ncbi:hypothetical protein RND81_05G233000 [Saponaria officinalis]|uniref:Uncharacterized protein n=1 Tax=Saponaria officinalis TaxID=3572 RepID=A0AAW1KW74_SAPOF
MEGLFTLLVLFTLLSFHAINLVEGQNPSFDAIYQFGDSLSDTGNDIILHGGCDKSPYGDTYFKRATGRCSDGLLMVDYFAQAFNVPLLNPYLDQSADFSRGANFAVAGAPAMATSNISLSSQIDWFKSLLSKSCSNQADCKQKLGNSLFIVGEIGGNDYNGPAFGGTNPGSLRSLVPQVIQAIISGVKQLIDLGASRIVVPGNFPAGCLTIYLVKYETSDKNAYDEFGCLKDWNDLASYHNGALQEALKTLEQQHSDVKIAFVDYFPAFQNIYLNAASLGFDKDGIHKACCGAGDNEYNWDQNKYCANPGVGSCPDPNVRMVWDGVHLTQHAYQIIADQVMKQFVPLIS